MVKSPSKTGRATVEISGGVLRKSVKSSAAVKHLISGMG